MDAARLSAELERATLRALADTWDTLNWTHFRRALRRPVLALTDTGVLGRWIAASRTLEISRTLLLEQGWGAVVEVLKHELAHQYVDEVLGLHGEAAHGPAFRKICVERGIDARAAGDPNPDSGTTPHDHVRVLERVAKLLALAESPNVHEAQAAMNAAQRLMLKYNLESIAAGRHSGYGFRHLGRASGRVGESQRILAAIICDHFFVQGIWVRIWRPLEGKWGSVLEVCGSSENLEMAEYVHSFLSHTAERLWRDYKRERGLKRDAKRRTFVTGVMAGFRDKLRQQKRADEQQGLVWIGDSELEEFFKQRHPRIRWTRHYGTERSDAFYRGHEAGGRIVLHRGVSEGSSGSSPLLPSGPGR
jgi:hypothetical protein